MPTPITHIAASAAIGLTGAAAAGCGMRDAAKLAALCAVASVIPDMDSVAALLPNRMQPFWGHRGIFHSPFFALAVALVLSRRFTATGGKAGSGAVAFLAIWISGVAHPVMDAMTDSGLGVMLYAPFDFGRHFLPWRVIHAERPETLGGIEFRHVAAAVESELVWWIIFTAYCAFPYAAIRKRSGG